MKVQGFAASKLHEAVAEVGGLTCICTWPWTAARHSSM